MEEDLRRILAGDAEPVFHFQPVADLQRAVVAGYEALVRLPLRRPLAPDLCLQAACRMGLQIELEELMVRRALQARSMLPANSFLCLNVSPGFLLSPAWERVLDAQRDLQLVVVEITEEQCILDYGQIRGRVAAIRAKGGLLAIDDAGAGYASLKHILELRPSFIKLDRAFISDCDRDPAKAVVIEMMGAAASRMDAWLVAEGVETQPELAELVRLGVPLAQGYFLGRPMPRMEPLLPAALEALRGYALCCDPKAEPLLLHAEVCLSANSAAEAEATLLANPAQRAVAVTDSWGRPVALAERHPVYGVRHIRELLRCQLSSSIEEVVQRALTRSPASRFDPVVLIDREGVLWGLAHLDRLMKALLPAEISAETSPKTLPNNPPW